VKTHWIILSTALVFGGFAPSVQSTVLVLSDATRGWFPHLPTPVPSGLRVTTTELASTRNESVAFKSEAMVSCLGAI